MSRVSIIIPTYNHAPFVLDAVDCALKQDYPDKEIIVIDDGSTDNTKDLLKPYVEAGRIIYHYQKNSGLAAARNAGLRLCKGEVVKFLDSDDLIYESLISRQMEDMKSSGTGLTYCDYENLYVAEGIKRFVRTESPGNYSGLAYFIKANPAPVHAFLVKKDLAMATGGFDETLKAQEDLDLWLRLLLKGCGMFKGNYVGCIYRIFPETMSSDDSRMFEQKCRVFEKLNGFFLESRELFSKQEKAMLLGQDMELIYKSMAKGKRASAMIPAAWKVSRLMLSSFDAGVIRAGLVRLLGLNAFLRLALLKKQVLNQDYIRRIKRSEIWWRDSGRHSVPGAPPSHRGSHENSNSTHKDSLHKWFGIALRR
ncbi:MAG: glycosyltransferase family A protein [Candidatus Omnitrophota bacterium]